MWCEWQSISSVITSVVVPTVPIRRSNFDYWWNFWQGEVIKKPYETINLEANLEVLSWQKIKHQKIYSWDFKIESTVKYIWIKKRTGGGASPICYWGVRGGGHCGQRGCLEVGH